jgi:hypothetical protein
MGRSPDPYDPRGESGPDKAFRTGKEVGDARQLREAVGNMDRAWIPWFRIGPGIVPG